MKLFWPSCWSVGYYPLFEICFALGLIALCAAFVIESKKPQHTGLLVAVSWMITAVFFLARFEWKALVSGVDQRWLAEILHAVFDTLLLPLCLTILLSVYFALRGLRRSRGQWWSFVGWIALLVMSVLAWRLTIVMICHLWPYGVPEL